MNDEKESDQDLPLEPPLSAEEARVLGCLIEKESATPENYPLTQNATATACNQKTSRHPVMKLDPGRVGQALRQLEQRGLVKSDFGARATRYAHRADGVLELTPGQRALIGLMMLRGPQTVAELYTRSERLHRFDDLDDVRYNLERLSGREPPMVVCVGRAPGQREDRYMHRLCGEVEAMKPSDLPGTLAGSSGGDHDPALDERISELEARVDRLEELMAEWSDSEDGENESDTA